MTRRFTAQQRSEQFSLFDDVEAEIAATAADGRQRHHRTFGERGLGRADRTGPGPARLLRRLVRCGLREDALTVAAALVLELDNAVKTTKGRPWI